MIWNLAGQVNDKLLILLPRGATTSVSKQKLLPDTVRSGFNLHELKMCRFPIFMFHIKWSAWYSAEQVLLFSQLLKPALIWERLVMKETLLAPFPTAIPATSWADIDLAFA